MIKKSLLIIIAGISVSVAQAMNDQFVSLPSARVIERTLRSAGFSEIVDVTSIQSDLADRTLFKQDIRNKVDAYADEVPIHLGDIYPEVSQADRDKIAQILFTLNLNKQLMENTQLRNLLNTEVTLRDKLRLNSDLPFIEFKNVTTILQDLGGATLSPIKIVEIVDENLRNYKARPPRYRIGLWFPLKEEHRQRILRAVFSEHPDVYSALLAYEEKLANRPSKL